jgi:3'(2'), 5'-bisphosphate nucleotidase
MPLSLSETRTLLEIVDEAGRRIMPYFRSEHNARAKDDRSPVTDADIAAHDYIVAALAKHFPEIPVISEEDKETGRIDHARFFLVDPLDGTRSFIEGEDEFTVNIGLVENNVPVTGALGAPAKNVLYAGGVGVSPFRIDASGEQPIRVRAQPAEGLVVTRSKSHPSKRTQDYLDTLSIQEVIPAGSSIKFCWVAEGSADIYVRLGRTMEWDTAAGHAILNAAGGKVWIEGNLPLTYGKAKFENPGFFAGGA